MGLLQPVDPGTFNNIWSTGVQTLTSHFVYTKPLNLNPDSIEVNSDPGCVYNSFYISSLVSKGDLDSGLH